MRRLFRKSPKPDLAAQKSVSGSAPSKTGENDQSWIEWRGLDNRLSAEEKAAACNLILQALRTMGQDEPWIPVLVTDKNMSALAHLSGCGPGDILSGAAQAVQQLEPDSTAASLCFRFDATDEQSGDIIPTIYFVLQTPSMEKAWLLAAPLALNNEVKPHATLGARIAAMTEIDSLLPRSDPLQPVE